MELSNSKQQLRVSWPRAPRQPWGCGDLQSTDGAFNHTTEQQITCSCLVAQQTSTALPKCADTFVSPKMIPTFQAKVKLNNAKAMFHIAWHQLLGNWVMSQQKLMAARCPTCAVSFRPGMSVICGTLVMASAAGETFAFITNKAENKLSS